jgi:hypothetical protein
MEIPGGLLCPGGVIDRSYAWKPLDGVVEVAVAAAAHRTSRPQAVSDALTGALAMLGGEPVTRERVDALSVPDRRFLMIQLACRFGASFAWWTRACEECGTLFQFPLDLGELPATPAGDLYPETEVQTTRLRVRIRVPTGADQLQVAAAADGASASRLLARLCVAPCDEATIDDLSAEDLALIDQGLKDLGPTLPWGVEALCPECETRNAVPIDTMGWIAGVADGPTAAVHEIAMAYGWSERDILALSRAQRLKYLALIRAGPDMQAT